jgi:hypothetical protein
MGPNSPDSFGTSISLAYKQIICSWWWAVLWIYFVVKNLLFHDELGRLQIVGANQCLQVTDFGLISVLCNQITSSHFLVELEMGPYTQPDHQFIFLVEVELEMCVFEFLGVKPLRKCSHRIRLCGIHCVAKYIEVWLKIFTWFLAYCQIWLNLHRMDDCHFFYIFQWMKFATQATNTNS